MANKLKRTLFVLVLLTLVLGCSNIGVKVMTRAPATSVPVTRPTATATLDGALPTVPTSTPIFTVTPEVMASAVPTATPTPTEAPFVPTQTVTPIIRTWQEWTNLTSFPAPESDPTNVIRVEDTLWVSVSSGRLYHLDLQGDTVNEMDIPAACRGHWAWDGESLWVSRGNTVHQCDPNTWEVLGTFETDLDSIRGIAWDGEAVWVIDSDCNLRSYDHTGQRLRRFAVSVGGSGWPIGMLWVEEELWIVRVHGTVLRYESVGFEVVGSFDLTQCGVAWAPADVAASWDGENLWVADTDNNRILQCAPGE